MEGGEVGEACQHFDGKCLGQVVIDIVNYAINTLMVYFCRFPSKHEGDLPSLKGTCGNYGHFPIALGYATEGCRRRSFEDFGARAEEKTNKVSSAFHGAFRLLHGLVTFRN
jgi:hypothetical protein